MADNFNIKPVIFNMTDESLVPAANTTSLDGCINLCYYSMLCATVFYDENVQSCYFSNTIYTLYEPNSLLTDKTGVTGYEWTSGSCDAEIWAFHRPTGFCILFRNQMVTQSSARSKCVSFGGRLLNIMNAFQNAAITASIQYIPRAQFWIGIQRPFTEWHLGGNVSFTNWNPPAEPKYNYGNIAKSSKWLAFTNVKKVYICEKVLPPPCDV